MLKDSINLAFDTTQRFLASNRYRVADWMDDIQETCKTVLPDSRPPSTEGSRPSWISRVLNNPVVKALLKFNPLSWIFEAIMEGIEETLGDKLLIPSLDTVLDPFRKVVGGITTQFVDLLPRLFEAVWNEVRNILVEPRKIVEVLMRIIGDVFHTGFDAMRIVVLTLYDALVASLQAVRDLLGSKWVIPGLTDKWEDDAGQEFSLLNCGTYLLALFINIVHPFTSSESELPLDGYVVPKVDSVSIPLIETEKMKRLAAEPAGPHDLIVMMASSATSNTGTTSPESDYSEEVRLCLVFFSVWRPYN